MAETEQSSMDDSTNNITIPTTKREFHDVQTSTYWLPKDDSEQMRLSAQHYAVKEVFKTNVLSSVTEMLDFNRGIDILDVGCGPGAWIIDMINDYPNCRYQGCDMVDVINRKTMPEQLRFCTGNVVEGLPYADNTFDFVHMRLFVLALRSDEWPKAIKEILRVTKPGGIVQLPKETDNLFYKANKALHIICQQRGQIPSVGRELERMLREAGNTKILESVYIPTDTTTGTIAAKKLAWSWSEGTRGAMSVLGPAMGVTDEVEQQKFVKDFHKCMLTKCGFYNFNAVAAQKL
ncbi:hypothetical protein RMCBS344292_14772 [Rhizopus microsporus]|nr:hypothetical protein RMCBS344292_14772 [Rhizopus microsporus]